MNTSLPSSAVQERFRTQLSTLIAKGYPKLAGLTEEAFKELITPLQTKLSKYTFFPEDFETGKLPFVIVISDSLIPARKLMELTEKNGKQGFEKLDPKKPEDYHPIESVTIPEEQVYLLLNIDRGKEFLNITPEKALVAIQGQKRSPLTINEGIAVITQYPEFLMKNNCFSLPASRCGDQTVPALWISEGRPKLGWCWDRNPHTWLGSISCKERLS